MSRSESVTLSALPGIPLIRAGDDLASLILSSLSEAGVALEDQDVIVLGQKIVSKAEGRLRNLAEVTPGEAACASHAAGADHRRTPVGFCVRQRRDRPFERRRRGRSR